MSIFNLKKSAPTENSAGKARRSYLVCSTPRSGSNLLCEALKNTKLAGRPHQYFWVPKMDKWGEKYGLAPDEDFAGYVRGIVEKSATSNGIFGLKSMWDFLLAFEQRLRATPEYANFPGPLHELLAAVFPDLRYVHITRRDKVQQAVSLVRAIQSDLWTSQQQDARPPKDELRFDPDAIRAMLRDLEEAEAGWESLFTAAGVQPHRVTYEDLANAYEETAIGVLNYLEIPLPAKVPFGERKLQKQGDGLNEEWAASFR
ncbi:MAG: Stf0 family sulfotransferase, partial [Chthoniobacteraceae bacterium]